MRSILMLSGLLISLNLSAATLDDFFQSAELERACSSTLKSSSNSNFWKTFKPRFSFDKNKEVLYYAIRDKNQSYSIIQTDLLNTPNTIYYSNEPIVDIEIADQTLWIAHKEYIHKYDLASGVFTYKIKTLPVDRSLTKHEIIHDIHHMQGILYVAQGVRGVFALDENSNQVIWNEYFNINQSNGHRSKVINIVGENGVLFAGLENLTMPTRNADPFNGFLKFSANDPRNYIESPYDRNRAGVMAYAHTTLNNDTIYINNMGHLQFVETSVLRPSKKIRPRWYPNWYQDVDLRRTAMWVGNVLIDNNSAYGCAHFSYAQNLPRPTRVARPLITKF